MWAAHGAEMPYKTVLRENPGGLEISRLTNRPFEDAASDPAPFCGIDSLRRTLREASAHNGSFPGLSCC